jgi:hypothetical protein
MLGAGEWAESNGDEAQKTADRFATGGGLSA